ncbi:MAG: signal peptidase I [Verrucomicrobia bacterium]|nr:signal peptidase I [Verrucomicrobiota bacterium]MCH8513049.1 signal peptidase I [Kiritimatiellia bacterium]
MLPFINSHKKEQRKHIEHAIFCVKYARRMKEDLLTEEEVHDLRERQAQLKTLLKAKKLEEGVELADESIELSRKIHPAPRGAYALRENVEVFVVVLAVALGFRTYFLQPYQIPTGSMQPTLWGITAEAKYEPNWTDRVPFRWGKFLLTGSRYIEVKAKSNGIIPPHDQWSQQDTFMVFRFGNNTYRLHQEFDRLIQPGQAVQKGQVLARGLRKQGDHIVVNRLSTNFFPPKRGDIVVFSTRGIDYESIRENTAYIKRLVGLPHESISICEGHLQVNGENVTAPEVFVRQMEGRGYEGYANRVPTGFNRSQATPLFPDCEAKLELGENEFLFFGDNTYRSLDGRHFGGVSGRNVIGTAFFVPWPFINRGAYNENAGFVK